MMEQPFRHILLAAIIFVGGAAGTASAGPQSREPPKLQVEGSEAEILHDGGSPRCDAGKLHIDAPVRVFLDQFNIVHMIMSDPRANSWQWTGPASDFTSNPFKAALDCNTVMRGNVGDGDPSRFNQKTWIQALFFNGTDVYAYGHQDYIGGRSETPNCHRSMRRDNLPSCWYASISVWKATPTSDRRLNFTQNADPAQRVAIYPNTRYPGPNNTPAAGWIGYGTPSNIVRGRTLDGRPDGYWYMFAFASAGTGGQQRGVCLFRSNDPTDVRSWRAWDGNIRSPQFNQVMRNPYSAENAPCPVVKPRELNSYVRTVLWHGPSGHYVAVLRDGKSVEYSTSTNLLDWSAPRPLYPSASRDAVYPVLIDFDGGKHGDNNFERIYDNGNLYLVFRRSVARGHTQILRLKVHVANYEADAPSPGNGH